MKTLLILLSMWLGSWLTGSILMAQAQVIPGVPTEAYDRLSEELDYSKTKTKLTLRKVAVKPDEQIKKPEQGLYNNRFFFQVLAYVVIGALVLFIIYIVFSQIQVEKKVGANYEVISTELSDLEMVDFAGEYERAMAQGDYRQAIRLLFIRALKYLSDHEQIVWEPDKTNRQYLGELSEAGIYEPFKELAHIYEWVWYGHTVIDKGDFEQIQPKFHQFYQFPL